MLYRVLDSLKSTACRLVLDSVTSLDLLTACRSEIAGAGAVLLPRPVRLEALHRALSDPPPPAHAVAAAAAAADARAAAAAFNSAIPRAEAAGWLSGVKGSPASAIGGERALLALVVDDDLGQVLLWILDLGLALPGFDTYSGV